MQPFLVIISWQQSKHEIELMHSLEKDTPVDFLILNSSETEINTYRYAKSDELLKISKEILSDYATTLLIGGEAQAIFKNKCENIIIENGNSIWSVDANLKKVFCKNNNHLELMRYFFIKNYEVFMDDNLQVFKGLTLAEFTLITQLICLNNGNELDKLLRNETPLYFPEKPATLNAFPFLNSEKLPTAAGILQIATNQNNKMNTLNLPVFILLKPHLHLWIYTKPFATTGSLEYDLKKLLKETHHRLEEVKFVSFSNLASWNDHNILFMDNFETDNELELVFNFDTISTDMETFAISHGHNLLGERSSKSSRMVLLCKEKRLL